MCALSLSLIQTGTNWLVNMPMAVRKTISAIMVPTVEATPSSSSHRGDFLMRPEVEFLEHPKCRGDKSILPPKQLC